MSIVVCYCGLPFWFSLYYFDILD